MFMIHIYKKYYMPSSNGHLVITIKTKSANNINFMQPSYCYAFYRKNFRNKSVACFLKVCWHTEFEDPALHDISDKAVLSVLMRGN
jgi:hypothetical protein